MDSHWNKGDWLSPTQFDILGMLSNIGRKGNEIIDSILSPLTEKSSSRYDGMSEKDKALLYLEAMKKGETADMTKGEQKKAWKSLLKLGYDESDLFTFKKDGTLLRLRAESTR